MSIKKLALNRYASVLGLEVDAHVTSSFNKFSKICNNKKYNRILESYSYSDIVPQGEDNSGFPTELIQDFINEQRGKMLGDVGDRLIHFCTLLYWLYKSDSVLDYGVSIISFLTSIGFGPQKILELYGEDNPLNMFVDTDDEILPEGLETISNSWRLLKSNPMFSKISLAFSFVTTVLVGDIEGVVVDKGIIGYLSECIQKVHSSAIDVVDAMIEGFCWMCTVGVAVLKTGSLSPLLYANPMVKEFDDLFIKVNANKNSAINGNIDDLNDYEKDLDRCLDIIEILNSTKLDILIRRYLQDKFAILIGIKESLYTKRKNCEMRFCPIGFSLFGGSGVGKTTVAKLIMRTSLSAMQFPYDDKHQITLDMSDKYHSTLTNDVYGIYFDDLANTTSEFSQNGQIPSNVIIKFFNNVPGQAIKADVSDKGKTMINLKCGVVTTNCKDLDAAKYSNCPSSILRRLYHITVAIKPKYCIPGSSMLNVSHEELVQQSQIGAVDVWSFKIEEAIPSGISSYAFRLIDHEFPDGKRKCDALTLKELMFFVRDVSKVHKTRQDTLLRGCDTNGNFMCVSCDIPFSICECQGLDDVYWIGKNVMNWLGYVPLEQIPLKSLLPLAIDACNITLFKASAYLPECFFQSSFFNLWYTPMLIRMSNFDNYFLRSIVVNYKMITRVIQTVLGICALLFWYSHDVAMVVLVSSLCYAVCYVVLCVQQYRKMRIERLVVSNRATLSEISKTYRDTFVPTCIVALAGVSVLVLGIKYIYTAYVRGCSRPQGSLDAGEVDKQPGWFGNFLSGNKQIVSTPTNGCSTHQMKNVVSRNIFYAEFKRDDGSSAGCCAVAPRKCILLFPKHMFYNNGNMDISPSKYLDIVLRRHSSYGGTFSLRLEWDLCEIHHDIVIAYFPNCPDLRDITKYFSENINGAGYCTLIRRLKDMDVVCDTVYARHGDVAHKYMSFPGSSYHTHLAQSGACMSILVNDQTNSSIVGFHIAGNSKLGVSILLPQSILLAAIDNVTTRNCGIIGNKECIVPHSTCGVPFLAGPLHHKSYCLSLSPNTCCDTLGSTAVSRQSTSTVVRSYLYDAMVEVFGPIDHWKPPDMLPNWKHYNLFIDKVTDPSYPFSPSLLNKAVRDYLAPLMTCTMLYVGVREPLSFKEGIMGIPGKRFFDPLIMSTSMGYPLFGKKKKFFVEHFDDNGVLIDREPSREVVTEYDRLLNCYKSNMRGFPVFSACLKDEVKDMSSEKVRVFTACPVAFSILVRQYFLPIAVFLQHYPLYSEMAVGVNAFGLQWQDLMEYSESYGDDDGGMFGMDYSAYDTRMNSQISRSVYFIMIQVAKELGYSPHDIAIMEAMVDDLTHPLVDVNGTMYQLYHMNPSGNNVTVQVNCIANSLYMRMSFYALVVDCENFSDAVHLITYGDDNKLSVLPAYRNRFTFSNVKKFLAQHNIKITAPDKSASDCDFMDLQNLDFLKRQSHYLPEINRSIGKLEEDSILKSLLHNVKSSKCTPKEVALSCIDGALHEWFAFGKNHYEMRRTQLRAVCSKMGLEGYPTLDITFDDRVDNWLNTYRPKPS